MRLGVQFRVEDVASRDIRRPHLTSAFLDVERKELCATNGCALAVVPVEVGIADRGGSVPTAAVKSARGKRSSGLVARRDFVVAGDVLHRRSRAPFPDIRASGVIPAYRPGDEGTVTIALNPVFLAALARAIGSANHVSLTFPAEADARGERIEPIYVIGSEDGAYGVLMPRRR